MGVSCNHKTIPVTKGKQKLYLAVRHSLNALFGLPSEGK